jgi:hypothetical protein
MKKFLFLLFAALSAAVPAQTFVSTNITTNTTWNLGGSPYIVTIDLVVFAPCTLTVDPGVVVRFDDGKELDLRGNLLAIGTPVDSILFTSSSATPAPGIWKGIRITGTTNPLGVGDQLTMKYCRGLYANRFADMDLAYHGPYIFEHCTFKNNTKVSHDGGMPYVRFSDCDFISNNTALDYNQFGGKVERSRFLKNYNGVDGFSNVDSCYFSGNTGVACSPYGAAVGNTIEDNNIGVRCYYNSENDSFIGNTVQFNTVGVEIMSYFNGSIVFRQNWICENTLYDVMLWTSNNADLSGNCWCNKGNPDPLKIYDGYDDPAQGLINTTPVAGNCPQSWTAVEPVAGNGDRPFSISGTGPGMFALYTALHDAQYEVYAVSGELISSGTLQPGTANTIDLQSAAGALYVIRVFTGEESWSGKVMTAR